MKAGKRIYFMRRADGVGPIKIGCSVQPTERLYFLNIISPYPLEVVAECGGAHDIERRLHAHFWEAHSHSEWFFPSPELVRLVEHVAAGKPVSELVDLSPYSKPVRTQRRKLSRAA